MTRSWQPGTRPPGRTRITAWQALVLAVSVAFIGCGGSGQDRADKAAGPAPAVEAVPARAGSLPLEEVLSGVVRARNQVAVRPEVSGIVVEVMVRNGMAVRAGQPLVRLDDQALGEQLRRAEAELRVAEASAAEAGARMAEVRARVVRTRSLGEKGLASELELETLEAQLEAAQASADQAAGRVEQASATVTERRDGLGKATVTAPVAGRVGQRDAEVGMVVGPSTMLFLIGDLEQLIVEVPLTQEMLTTVDVGTPVEIEARSTKGAPLQARISRISPFLETASFSTTAEIDLPGPTSGLRPGMFVTTRVLYGAGEKATLVPASAIWEDPLTGDATVLVVEDADGLREPEEVSDEIPDDPRQVVERPVEVLAEGGARVGVKGVSEGEWVVTLGQHLLQESLDAAGGTAVAARVRPTSWRHVLELEGLQREDLLEGFLAKQRVVAHAFGAELPESTAAVDKALHEARPEAGGQGAATGTGGR